MNSGSHAQCVLNTLWPEPKSVQHPPLQERELIHPPSFLWGATGCRTVTRYAEHSRYDNNPFCIPRSICNDVGSEGEGRYSGTTISVCRYLCLCQFFLFLDNWEPHNHLEPAFIFKDFLLVAIKMDNHPLTTTTTKNNRRVWSFDWKCPADFMSISWCGCTCDSCGFGLITLAWICTYIYCRH